MKNWYIVQSHSSFENKVAGLIKEEAQKANISDKIEERTMTLQLPWQIPLEHLARFPCLLAMSL